MAGHILIIASIIFVSDLFLGVNSNQKYANKLLLISMDGFRWDYLEKAGPSNTPNFNKLAQGGVKLSYMNSAFITKTFPDHYSIVTGLYEESHGIIGNEMYDAERNAHFTMASHESFWWEGGEPIWVTARKHNLKAGAYFWPGSEAAIHGYRPNIFVAYSDHTPYQKRIDTVMDWFVHENISVATLYFSEPDKTGHAYGPDSTQLVDKVIEMDGWLGKIQDAIERNGLETQLNFILLSDHGMANADVKSRVIFLEDYVNSSQLRGVYDDKATANILPNIGQVENVYNALRNAHPNMTVYRKEDIPDHFHYKKNVRVQPVFAMADESWIILKDRSTLPNYLGRHGYDNRLPSMRTIFFASGPNFKRNYQGQKINIVDVYPLMCELLGIVPARNNGSLRATIDFLVPLSSWDGSNGGRSTTEVHAVGLMSVTLYIIMACSLPL